MKQIQKGFTLIELMIVVAIIGILAAVAIPAYSDYVVKAKLSKVQTTLDPIKTAMGMYFQENGMFPNGVSTAGTANTALTQGSLWYSLGFTQYPSLPNEVSLISVDGSQGGATLGLIKVTLTRIKAVNGNAGFDGLVLALAGNPSSTAIQWNCSVVSGTSIKDPIGLKYFDPVGMTCAP